jgi:hypothetical protein
MAHLALMQILNDANTQRTHADVKNAFHAAECSTPKPKIEQELARRTSLTPPPRNHRANSQASTVVNYIMITRTAISLALLAAASISLQACEKKSETPKPAVSPTPAPAAKPAAPKPEPTKPAAPDTAKPATTELRAGGLTFTLPAGWETREPSSKMRLAEARLPGTTADGSQDCIAAWFQLGGDVDSNMTRWKGMVTKAEGTPADATVEVTEVSGVKVHTIEMTGAYVDGGMSGAGTKRDNWTFRGAIIETPGQLTFIRMTGPADIMEGQNTAWNEIVKSMR